VLGPCAQRTPLRPDEEGRQPACRIETRRTLAPFAATAILQLAAVPFARRVIARATMRLRALFGCVPFLTGFPMEARLITPTASRPPFSFAGIEV